MWKHTLAFFLFNTQIIPFLLLCVSLQAQSIGKLGKGFSRNERPDYHYKLFVAQQQPNVAQYQPQEGDKISFHYSLSVAGKSPKLLADSYEVGVAVVELPPVSEKEGHFISSLRKMGLGDSLVTLLKAKDIASELASFEGQINLKKDWVQFTYKLVAVQSRKDFIAQQAEAVALVDSFRYKLLAEVLNYEQKGRFAAATQRSPNGVELVQIQTGQGALLQNAEKASVHYICMLPNGNILDSSYPRQEPLNFYFGKNMVIKGWEEAVQMLQVGSRAIARIPYPLAYGEEGIEGQIPPKSDLYFWLEIVE